MMSPLALVVEDDRDLAFIFAKALQFVGCQVQILEDGSLATAWLSSGRPDIVVLDLHLPGVSGQDILATIRAESGLANTRVIIVTADPILAEEMEGQADMVLVKPVSFMVLCDLVKDFVDVYVEKYANP